MIGVGIRPVSPRDYDTLRFLEEGSSGCRYQAAVFVRQAMTLWPRSFLVADTGGSPVGYIVSLILSDDPSCGWIIRLRVDPRMQRQGVGTALIREAHRILRDMGALRVLLSCSPVNQGALSLYAKEGYREIRHEREYFGPGEDRVILSKSLVERPDP